MAMIPQPTIVVIQMIAMTLNVSTIITFVAYRLAKISLLTGE
jgi:hypothetical protein